MGGSWDATNLIAGDVGRDHADRDGPRRGARPDARRHRRPRRRGSSRRARSAVVRSQDPAAAVVLAPSRRRGRRDAAARGRGLGGARPAARRRRAGLRSADAARDLRGPVRAGVRPLRGAQRRRRRRRGRGAHRRTRSTRARCARGSLRCARPAASRWSAHEPAVVLDGAHNPAGAEALAEALGESFRWERLHVVLAVSANKDVAGWSAPLAAIADVVYATRNDCVRSAEPEEVARRGAGRGARPPSRCGRRVADAMARGPRRGRTGRPGARHGLLVHGGRREAGPRPRLTARLRLRPAPTSP